MPPDGPNAASPRRVFSRISRRDFLAVAGLTGAALALDPTRLIASSLPPPRPQPPEPLMVARAAHHLAWVWQFAQDGSREVIRERLAQSGLGIALKTHDGLDWMSEHDPD